MRRLVIVFGLIFSFSAMAVELKGQITQGSLVRGEVTPGSKVWLDDTEIKVSADGYFAFGFGRDAKLNYELSWQEPNQQKQSKTLQLAEREYNIQAIEGLPQKMVTPPDSVLRENSTGCSAGKKKRVHWWMTVLPSWSHLSGLQKALLVVFMAASGF